MQILTNIETKAHKVQGQFGLMMFSAQDMKSILISAHSEAGDSQIVTTCTLRVTVS